MVHDCGCFMSPPVVLCVSSRIEFDSTSIRAISESVRRATSSHAFGMAIHVSG